MTTVGYGDISPINSYEKMFGICATIMCCGIYGFALNCIGQIFQEKANMEADLKSQKYALMRYMKERKIDKDI
jgi:hypothetical protein